MKCANCHTDGGIAPFSLETYEQMHAVRGAVKAAVVARTMPPWLAAKDCTDYRGDLSLTDDQIDSLSRWVDAGAPLGDPNEPPVPVTSDPITLSRVDLELSIPTPYTPIASHDDYRCFFLDWPVTETAYVTGFVVTPGNEFIVHHVIAYVVRPQNVPVFQALDDADAGPGWACFGGPGGEGAGPPQASWLGGWVPGNTGEDFPEGTGIEIPTGAKLVVQIHYNSHGSPPAPDQTKILLRTDAAVQKKAAIMPFTDIQWVLNGTMTIPAHSKDVAHSFDADPTTIANLMTGGTLADGKPLTLYSAGLHMHTLGKRVATRLDRADGTSECHVDVPRWDFDWQRSYTFATPKQVAPGDKLHLECQWDNAGNTDVNWGEGTGDEMCLSPYYVTE